MDDDSPLMAVMNTPLDVVSDCVKALSVCVAASMAV
jgi:hypothetical protein